jgi:hypothetical protein
VKQFSIAIVKSLFDFASRKYFHLEPFHSGYLHIWSLGIRTANSPPPCPFWTNYSSSGVHIFVVRSLSALAITETELKLIAAAAIIGFKSRPNAGKSTPAASGTPTTL